MKIKDLTYPHRKKSCNDFCPVQDSKNECPCERLSADLERSMIWIGYNSFGLREDAVEYLISAFNEYENSVMGDYMSDTLLVFIDTGQKILLENLFDPTKSFLVNCRNIIKKESKEMNKFIGEYYKEKRKRAEVSGSKGLTEECDKRSWVWKSCLYREE